jgi:Circadian oscillating protein COP23
MANHKNRLLSLLSMVGCPAHQVRLPFWKATSLSMALVLGGSGLLISSTAIAAPIATVKQATPSGTDSTTQPSVTTGTRFECQMVDGQYTVMYSPESQPGQSYPWATPTALGGGWSPELRCNEISRRLESYRPDGLLEMQTGMENGYNTICVTTQQDATCRIVLTVPPGQDPLVTRDRVFENLAVADSGQQTDGVATFSGGDNGLLNQIGDALDLNLPSLSGRSRRADSINLRPFLDRADGGTGTRLQSGQANPQLNPDRFR